MLTIISLIETTIPSTLDENDCGVCQRVLQAKGKLKKHDSLNWTIQIFSINGIWRGASSCNGSQGGYGIPCTRRYSQAFATAEECIDYHYKRVYNFFKNEGKDIPPKPSFNDFKDSYPFNE